MQFSTKYLLLFLPVLFFTTQITFSQEKDPLITEIQLVNGDSTYRYLYIYNEENVKVLETKYVKIADSWLRKEQTQWVYSNGICTEQRTHSWKNGEWQLIHKIVFEYTDNQLIAETHLSINSGVETYLTKTEFEYYQHLISKKTTFTRIVDTWRKDAETDYAYNENLLIDRISFKLFENNILSEESKTNYFYNDSLDVKKIITAQKSDTTWINSTLSTFYYKPNSRNKSSEIVKKWNSVYNTWENYQNLEYKYNGADQLIEENYQHWNSAFWVNDLKNSYQFNTDGLLLKKTTFLPIFNDYRPFWSINYTDFKNQRANLIEAKNEFWGGETGALINTFIPYQFNSDMVIKNGSRVSISYIPVEETGNLPVFWSGEKEIHVYPNPSKAIFYFNSEKYLVKKWSVSDLSGKTLLTKEQKETSGVIDLGDFKPGIYLLQVFTPDGIKTQKLIKE